MRVKQTVFIAGAAAALLILGLLGKAGCAINAPVAQPLVSFEVKDGASLGGVLRDLGDRGVLPQHRWLYYYARITSAPTARSGDYEITPEQSGLDVLHMLGEGRVKLESFTIAEGLNRWQVRDLLSQKRWMTAKRFDALCDDAEFLRQQNVPGPTCDGYMFPETYTFARGTAPEAVFVEILQTYRGAYETVARTVKAPLQLAERELVTLASIVEKETGAAHERPRIACLFYNRLTAKPRWRLDTDPTVIYAATLRDPEFDGNLRTWHLREMQHPYNTYLNKGLPPGPIASPGMAALQAVAQPATCSDFFFVSKNNGEHVFCDTLACHEKQVKIWQIDYFRKNKRL